jgi:transposase-like protein
MFVSSWYIFTGRAKENKMTQKIKRYSETFRRQVVGEYEAGSNLGELRNKYGINGMQTIQGWVRKYGKQGFRHEVVHIQTVEEVRQVKELEQRVDELEQALGKVTLEKLKLESILEEMQVDSQMVKKNARPLSNALSPKPTNGAEMG